MHVRPIDPDDDAATARWHEIRERAESFEAPWSSVPSLKSDREQLRMHSSNERVEALAAYDGDEMVGAAFSVINLLANRDKAWGRVFVEPAQRRRGVGRALVGALEDQARAAGATYLMFQTSYPIAERETHGYRRFAEALGYRLDLDEIQRVLPLPVDDALLTRLLDEAAPYHRGYRIETWVYDVPDEYLDGWIAVHNLLAADAPMGEVVWEADRFDRTSWAEDREMLRGLGRELFTAAAISPDGEVVAFSDLVLQDNGTGRVSQWGTLVRADHRGHRLGTAVKASNLRALQAAHPDRTEVHTTNAETNAPMVGINEVLGFAPVAVHPGFYKRLDGAAV